MHLLELNTQQLEAFNTSLGEYVREHGDYFDNMSVFEVLTGMLDTPNEWDPNMLTIGAVSHWLWSGDMSEEAGLNKSLALLIANMVADGSPQPDCLSPVQEWRMFYKPVLRALLG